MHKSRLSDKCSIKGYHRKSLEPSLIPQPFQFIFAISTVFVPFFKQWKHFFKHRLTYRIRLANG